MALHALEYMTNAPCGVMGVIEYSLFFFSLTIKDKKHYVLKWLNSLANGQLCKMTNVIGQGFCSLYGFSAVNRIVYKYFNSLTLTMRQN